MLTQTDINNTLEELQSYYDGLNERLDAVIELTREIKEACENSTTLFKERKRNKDRIIEDAINQLTQQGMTPDQVIHIGSQCYERSQQQDFLGQYLDLLENVPTTQTDETTDKLEQLVFILPYSFTPLSHEVAYSFLTRICDYNDANSHYVCDALYACEKALKLLPQKLQEIPHFASILRYAARQHEADKVVLSAEYKAKTEEENKKYPHTAMSFNLNKLPPLIIDNRALVFVMSQVYKSPDVSAYIRG